MAPVQFFRLAVIYAGGVLAAAQYGKLATLAPLIQAELGTGLIMMAVAIGLIEIGGAVLGLRAGLLAQHLGLNRTMVAALIVLALASLGSATAADMAGLIAWRLLEAVGYLGVVVSAPALIMRTTAPHIAARMLALWSTFVPVGFALGAWVHSVLATSANWRMAVAADSVVAAALAVAIWTSRVRTGAAPPAPRDTLQTVPPASRYLAVSYGCFVSCRVGVFALLPSILVARSGLTVAEAGLWTSAVTFSTVFGSAIAAIALNWPDRQRSLSTFSLLLPAVLMFAVLAGPASPIAIGSAAVAMFVLLGVFGGLLFGWLATLSGGPDRGAASFGLLAQCGATGALAGPSAMAATVQHGSGTAAAGLGLVLLVATLALAYKALGARPSRSASQV